MTKVGLRTQGAKAGPSLMRYWPRIVLSLGLGGFMIWLLIGRLSSIEPAAVALAFASVPAQAWAMAIAATLISFWAVGSYDAVIHRHFATGQPPARSRLAGICAIAVSQMIGLGVVSGAVLRWRMLPDISLWQATRLTAAVALSFLGAWAMVTALVLLILPGAPFKLAAAAVLLFGTLLAMVSVASPRLRGLSFRWPNGLTLGQLFGLCVVDTLAAALAFYALCPPGIDFGLAALLPAFLLALGAGLISGAPGGMGAFEVTLLALLPAQPEPDLIAAILAWRIVYFALPAILGAAIAIIGPRRLSARRAATDPDQVADLVLAADHAEVQIWRQGEHGVIGTKAKGLWVAGRTSHGLVGLFAPFAGAGSTRKGLTEALRIFAQTAQSEGRSPILYKADPRLAVAARAMGFQVIAMAREATLALASYRTETSSRSGLRRKLRRAEAAGVCVLSQDRTVDWDRLAAISAEWTQAHGQERGFSMGRFQRSYAAGQRIFVATLNAEPIAFVTVHAGPRQWVLDIMRHRTGVPDGTMHLLVQTAIDQARAEQISQFSLAAVPETAFATEDGAMGWLYARIGTRLGADAGLGLARFKSSFAPRWEPRYICAANRALFPLLALEIARAIHSPPPLARKTEALTPLPAPLAAHDPSAQADQMEYGFASAR